MPQEPIEDETSDFAIGYIAGAKAASYGTGLCDMQLAIVASIQYRRANRSFVLDQDRFING